VATLVPLVLAGEDGELGGQGAVEPIHQPIALWVMQCHSGLDHPQPPADLPEDLGLEIQPLVAVELGRGLEAGKHLLHQPFCCPVGALIRHRIAYTSGHFVK